jgi:membrane-associated protease RseP (regulator of RpoE activity)
VIVYGAPLSFTVLAIAFSHEMGHYFTARRYRIDTTLPFFIPFPISLVGTLGAFILIKSRFPHRKALIDVGLAGPFAGFLVTIPALFVGIATSRPGPALEAGYNLGEPLLFQWVAHWVWPNVPDGYTIYISPIGLAAWFGLLLTALNLLPIGQLDGGHASYAILGHRAHRVSAVVFFAFLPMAYFGPSWLVWAALLYALGIRRPHPSTEQDDLPLPRSRILMGIAALVVFVLCFTPAPIEVHWRDIWQSILELWPVSSH